MPARLRTPIAMLMLGLLAEQSRHIYDMRICLRERGHDQVVKVGRASLYDAAPRLLEAGLIRQGDTSKAGNRPERTVYHITDRGRATLQDWVRDSLSDPEQDRAGFHTALAFMFVLPRDEVVLLLDSRADGLAARADRTDEALAAAVQDGVPEIFLSDHRYDVALYRAETDWLRAFSLDLAAGRLGWPQ
jgi:DNA-binding PadR family transcriptional regulator